LLLPIFRVSFPFSLPTLSNYNYWKRINIFVSGVHYTNETIQLSNAFLVWQTPKISLFWKNERESPQSTIFAEHLLNNLQKLQKYF
jgi:hypothetical protein